MFEFCKVVFFNKQGMYSNNWLWIELLYTFSQYLEMYVLMCVFVILYAVKNLGNICVPLEYYSKVVATKHTKQAISCFLYYSMYKFL